MLPLRLRLPGSPTLLTWSSAYEPQGHVSCETLVSAMTGGRAPGRGKGLFPRMMEWEGSSYTQRDFPGVADHYNRC